MRHLLTFAAAVAAAGPVFAQDGGKIAWNHDPQAAIAEAKKTGKAMMMFFTSLG